MPTSEEFSSALQDKIAEPELFPPDRFVGDGIVVCAGGPRLFTCAWVLLRHLRRVLDCKLPVEVWHIGPEEMGPPMCSILEELGNVTIVDALQVARSHPLSVVGGWELKPFAIQHSRFERVIYIDADNLPVRDPSFLLEASELERAGAIFWPDIIRLRSDNPIWGLCGMPHRDMPSFETGQIVIDKSKCWAALSLVTWLNQQSDLLYEHIYGDKDTFLLGWLLTAMPFHLVDHSPKQISFTLLQHDLEGQILFQHRTLAKWVFYGVNKIIEGFQFEADCLEAIRHLHTMWNGKVFHPPTRSTKALDLERSLSDHRHFRLTIVGSESFDLELLPAHRIGEGSSNLFRYWYAENENGTLRLVLEGNKAATARLQRDEAGDWGGTMMVSTKMPLLLEAVGELRPNVWPSHPPAAVGDLHDIAVKTLDHYRRLPLDLNLERDLEGAVRSFLRLDPSLLATLASWVRSNECKDPVAILAQRVLDTTATDKGDYEGKVRRGHNSFTTISNIDRKYEKSS